MGFELTDQQKLILKEFSNGIDMKINAFAGTGKTTTLKLLVENNPNKKFLVLVFNKSVADELQSKFPKNADISTIHSFALRRVRNKLGQFELYRNEKNLTLDIKNQFQVEYTLAQFYNSIFTRYCNSDYKKLNIETIKKLIESDDLLIDLFYVYRNHNNLSYGDIAQAIKEILLLMIDGKFKFTHGGYLKYFQLYINEFKNGIKYDVVMLDEGQDTNPVSLDIFKSVNGQKVIVGDTHQGIYGWRGAVNAMDSISYKDFYITKSFRINDVTAEQGNLILHNYKLENKPLEAEFSKGGKGNGKSCIIFRTNAGMIYFLLELVAFGSNQKFNLNRDKLEDIFHIMLDLGKVINYYHIGIENRDEKILEGIDERILYFTKINDNYSDFCDYIINELKDYELTKSLELLKKLNRGIVIVKNGIHTFISISIFDLYKEAKRLYDKESNFYLSTAHSVKGLEYDSVTIENDFPSIFQKLYEDFLSNNKRIERICRNTKYKTNIIYALEYLEDLFYDREKYNKDYKMRAVIEEINLMYVAITRSIKNLDIKSDAINLLLHTKKSDFMNKLYQLISDNSQSAIADKILLMEKELYKGGYLDIYGYDKDCYDDEGYDIYGYDKDGFNEEGLDREGYNKKGFDKNGWDRNFRNIDTKTKYDKDGYDKDGYNKDGFNKYGRDKDGYDKDGFKNGYDRDGYDKFGFNKIGIHKETGTKFDEDGYDVYGYDRNGCTKYDIYGYDKDGYDKDGFNRKGYDREGYNKHTGTKYDFYGFDEDGYDLDGFDKYGRDKDGYDKDGFNKKGYDREGYNKYGRDKDGYDKDGYDKDGFNRKGIYKETGTKFDNDGYDIYGYDLDGFDKYGRDKDGYDKDGFNKRGIDKNGYNRDGFKDGYDKDGYDRRGFNKKGIHKETGTKFDEDGYDAYGYNKDGYSRSGKKYDNNTLLGNDGDIKYWATK